MKNSNFIHETAIIDSSVKMGNNNYIGAYCIIKGNVDIGDNNRFESHVCIGAKAQHRNENLPCLGVKIGSNNIIREFCTIHSGTEIITTIGDYNYLMNYVHIPHDCILENNITISNSTQIAGHCIIKNNVNIGLNVNIHQHSIIGEGSMIGMGTVIPKMKRILPYKVYVGNPCKEIKDNVYLIEKLNIDTHSIIELRKKYNSEFNKRFF